MTLTPRLVVADADAAVAFLATTLGAEPGLRLTGPDDEVVHAEVTLDGTVFSLTESGDCPARLGGSPVLLHLQHDDPDAVQARWVAAGGEVVFPVADRVYGVRDGRLRDPSGHLWLVARPTESLDAETLQDRLG